MSSTHLENIEKVLIFVASKLNSLEIDWFLGSSAALMIQGINIIPKDLDILTSSKNLDHIAPAFGSFLISFDIDKIELCVNGIDVEIIKYGHPASISQVVFRDVSIPVDSLENKLAYYKQVPGKEAIVKLIEDKLSSLK